MARSLRTALFLGAQTLFFLPDVVFSQPANGRVTYWTSSSQQSGDDALTWDSGANKLAINPNTSAPATAKLQALWDSSSGLYPPTGQLWGDGPRVFAIGDGSPTQPVAGVEPTFVVQRKDVTDTGGAYTPFEFNLVKTSGSGFMYSLHSNIINTSPTLSEAIPITGSVLMSGTPTTTETHTGFGLWSRAERDTVNARLAGAEFDVFNSTPTNAPAPFAGDFNNITLGMQIVGWGQAKNTMALEIAAHADDITHAQPGQWWSGIVFDSGSIAAGGYGIDLRKVSTAATPVLLPNNAYMKARNAADNADIRLLGVGGDDTLRLGSDDIIILSNEMLLSAGAPFGTRRVGVGTTLTAADAALEVKGGTSKGLRITPRTSAGHPGDSGWSVGTMVVDSTGVLYIYTTTPPPNGPWKKVGAQ